MTSGYRPDEAPPKHLEAHARRGSARFAEGQDDLTVQDVAALLHAEAAGFE